jgi:type II secretory pathway component PulL
METESILRRTLTLFAGAFVAAISVMGVIIWLTVRRGRARVQAQQT